MYRKLAICALAALILVPAAVLAAGPGAGACRGLGQDSGNLQNCTLMHQYGFCSGQQIQYGGQDTAEARQFMYGTREDGRSGAGKQLRTRSCDQSCTGDASLNRNQTRLRDGSCRKTATA
jgi:hypothetical protein